jgi:hypothetical protein
MPGRRGCAVAFVTAALALVRTGVAIVDALISMTSRRIATSSSVL